MRFVSRAVWNVNADGRDAGIALDVAAQVAPGLAGRVAPVVAS